MGSGNRGAKRQPLSLGYSIWMAVGVFCLYFSAGIGAIILLALAVRLLLRRRGGRQKSEQYGQTVVLPVITSLFEEAVYEPENGFPRDMIDKLGVLHRTARYRSRHRFSGRRHKIGFEAAAVTLFQQAHFFGSKPFAPVFDGLFLSFQLPEEVKGAVRVIPAAYRKAPPQNPDQAAGGKKRAGIRPAYPVDISYEGFSKRFYVYAEDPERAAPLFSDRFCKGLLEFADAANVPVLLSFAADRLFVGLDLERPAPLDAPDSDGTPEAQRQELRERLRIVIDCIDLLIAPECRAE
jgi:hypothetical protein